jgi:hypothetical protein
VELWIKNGRLGRGTVNTQSGNKLRAQVECVSFSRVGEIRGDELVNSGRLLDESRDPSWTS